MAKHRPKDARQLREEIACLLEELGETTRQMNQQVQAMADSVDETLGRAGVEPKSVEGYQTANWILMDYRDIVIHIFDEENRLFYDIERIWRDGQLTTAEELKG
ncbi:MAG: ribosome silencing factor [Eubacterium sp.]|nr:ribosome silencing factor [Eubacterium sp.]